MNAEGAVREAVAAALRGDTALMAGLNGVFDGPAVRASPPYAELGDTLASDWGTKDRRGREVRIAVMLRDHAERAARLGELAGMAGAAIEAMPRALDGWRIASLAHLRSRMAGQGPGKWMAVIEYRVRILEGDE
ncbi:DUF3168 domain-containing protein [Sphingomonas sp.]|uniref:DUF3168 domain-containing protein n=1 Tax=Sphingomonas sp. TaxID=28214 RepID=UPI002ED9A9F4